MKTLPFAIFVILLNGLIVMGGEPIQNVFKDIPYADGALGKRQLVDEKHLVVMQMALKPGQQVPLHNANSNVNLLILEGNVVVTLSGNETNATKGDLIPIAFKIPMQIRNTSKENATFLVLKTPNPSEIQK